MSRRLLSLFLVALVGGGVLYASELLQAWRLRRTAETLERDIGALRDEARDLARTADKLRTDPTEIERLAREGLGYVRPGERILRFDPSPGSR